jgi:predicted nucleic acid-binding protein
VTDDIPPIVLDSSVALAFLLDEESSPAIRATVRRWVHRGERFAVPSLFWLEVVNVLGRVRRLPGKVVIEGVFHLEDLGIATVEPDRVQLMLTIGRVERHGLTAYDASYLALAHSLSAPLATIDRRLAEAAGRAWLKPVSEPTNHRTSEVRASYDAEGTWPEFRHASAYLAKLRAERRQSAEGASRR